MSTKHQSLARVQHRLAGMVNIHGQPIVPVGPSFQPIRASRPPREKAQTLDEAQEGPTEFHGFRVVGFSPAAISAAGAAHDDKEAARAEIHKREKRPGQAVTRPFDAELWMSSTRPEPINKKPYAIRSAADQCAELARKAGWIRVTVIELKK